MKTSAIIVRVADFLKTYPPFSSLESEALLRVARSGRVRYHEKDEILFEEGQQRDGRLYVINKGAVRLMRKMASGDQVVDLRGKGDLLGAGGYVGEPVFDVSAVFEEDSILYALDLETFTRECATNPNASRFLAMYFATSELEQSGETFSEPGRHHGTMVDWFGPINPNRQRLRAKLIAGTPEWTVREAAIEMAEYDSGAFVVVDSNRVPLGIITEIDLRNRVATGEVPLDATVDVLMNCPVLTAQPDISVGDALLMMMRCNCRHVVLTRSGRNDEEARGLLSERELMLFYGNNPLTLIREIHRTHKIEMLATLRQRVEALLLAGLRSSADVPWFMGVMAETGRSLFQRLEVLCRESMGPPPAPYNILLTGSLGRRESLTRTDFTGLLIYDDSVGKENGWFIELLQRMTSAACQIGFAPPRHTIFPQTGDCCRSFSEWVSFYESLIADPIRQEIWRRLILLDLSALHYDNSLCEDLQARIQQSLVENPNFIRLLANDSLQNMPPMTIFEGYAVNADGLQLESLDVKKNALQPIIDVARVFQLESLDPKWVNTLDRLDGLAGRHPAQKPLAESAKRAFRICTYFRAVTGLTQGTDGMSLHPATLSRTDQVMLKLAFRSVGDLLKNASEHFSVGR